MNTPIPVAILVRVSTLKQDTDRQITELHALAAQNQWTVVEVIEEQGISRRAALHQRPGLQRAAELAATGVIRKVLVHEVSRVGRPAVVFPFVEKIHEHMVSLYWHAQRVETLLPDGRRSQAAGLMLALMSEMAHAEIETLSERTKSGLREARRRGVRLGRTKGHTESPETILAKYPDVVALVRAGKSLRDITARTGKAQNTVVKVRRLLAKDSD